MDEIFIENKEKGRDYFLFKRLMRYARPYILHIIISFILLALVVGVELVQPLILARAIDDSIITKDYNKLIKYAILFTSIILLGSGIQYLQALILQYTGQKIIYGIRMDVFSHIQEMEIDFFDSQPIGKLVTRVTNDTETLNEMYTSVITNSVKNIFLLIGIVIAMISFDLRLSLITYSVMPFLIIGTIIFRRYSKTIFRLVRENVSRVNAFLSEHISGMRIIQIFAKEEEKYDEFVKISGDLNTSYKNQIIAFSIFGSSIYLLRIMSTSIILYFGGKFVLAKLISIGTLIAFIQYISRFFHPVQELAEQFNVFQSAMASAERIFDLLDQKPKYGDEEDLISLDNIKGDIEFKNVWFAYKDEEWILKDVSFKVKAGETIAFVGATGAGKTTILNLIGKYYKIQKGEILIDGKNIDLLKANSLRRHIGQMLQDVFLFTGTIESNIKLRDEEISKNEVVKAAKYVNADFIEKLPNQYGEIVYERGSTLSAGQRQLLSFARTLVRKPSILILDEATANIDTETELLIQDALTKIMKGRTTLAVAHRLSTIQNSDKIILMHKGRIKEIGTHEELLNKKGLYYNLVQLQYQKI